MSNIYYNDYYITIVSLHNNNDKLKKIITFIYLIKIITQNL